MHGTVGDRIVVRGRHLGEADRDGEILEVHGINGSPPFVVRWSDDGHVGTFVPGPDARVEHATIDLTSAIPAPDDPVRREVVDGIAAVRADVARLRGALLRASGTLAAAEIAQGIAKVECEAAVLWGEVRAAEARSVAAVRAALDDAAHAVRTVVDDLHLHDADLDARWQEATAALARLRTDPTATLESAQSVAAAVLARLRSVVS